MGFKELIRDYIEKNNLIPRELLPLLPTGFQEIGKRAILNLKPELYPYKENIARAVMNVLPHIKAVWIRKGKIVGDYRQPTGLEFVMGEPGSEVIIAEHNVRYKFDFTRIMFAKGNIHERALLPKHIRPNSIIIDMFAGIGYFSLGIGKYSNPKKIYSIEWNPEAFHYLKENIKLNHLENVIEPLFGDCKEIVPKLAEEGVRADYIIMGLLPEPVDAISMALKAAKSGTVVVYEGVEEKVSSRLFDEFSRIALQEGFTCTLKDRRIVKSFAPKRYHIVLEIVVDKM